MEKDVCSCEVKTLHTGTDGKSVYGWVVMPVVKAYQLRDVEVRCQECHGRVRPICAGPNGVPSAYPKHHRKHPGCSLGDFYDGKPRMHPAEVA
jgi:hypothetical protein